MKGLFEQIKDYGGIGIGCFVFGILFILRLTGIIDWSWWWIVVPLWAPLSLDLLLSVIYVLYQVFFLKKGKEEVE